MKNSQGKMDGAKSGVERAPQSGTVLVLARGDRDGDRVITSVACPCLRHLYAWQTRTWFERLADGSAAVILAGEVPPVCRTSFAKAS